MVQHPMTCRRHHLTTSMFIMKKPTKYSIYSEDAKKRTKHNHLPDLYPELPKKNMT